jgi:hypothetical protein
MSISIQGRREAAGWLALASIGGFYALLFALNYALPLDRFSYTSRIWDWSQAALAAGAGFTLVLHRRTVTGRSVLLGFVLAAVSAASRYAHNPSLSWSVQEGLAVWVCYTAGAALFKHREGAVVSAFQAPPVKILMSVLFGAAVALPLAALNNLFFHLESGQVAFQNGFSSAFAALSPGVHEEVIYRFFVLAAALYLLRFSESRRWATAAAVVLAVVPHSLNHLPDLFLENPNMGLAMLAATSLLFGLPMAVLQLKRNLEAAIGFHWFIDFVRFWFGY